AYMAVSALWLLQDFAEHYTNFIIGIVLCSLLLAIRNVLKQGKTGSGRFRSFFEFKLLLLGLTLIVATIVLVYVRLEAVRLETIAPFINNTDIVMGILFIAVLLISSWFFWGGTITVLILAMVLYFFYGHHIPGLLTHQYFDPSFVVSYLTMSMVHGVYWFATIGADKIFLIVVFSGLLVNLGVLSLFSEIGKVLGRFVKGGAAFPSIFGSSMVAMVMGQAVANVALTGTMTIPLMKKGGFRPGAAGAVEAVASTGGQITPPIMGLAAFMMAGILGLPYISIALASVIPAILFYLVIIIGVLTYGYAHDIPGLRVPIDTRT
ncbi:unnamed protein product, partial [marine sediment metagenome]